MIYLTFDQLKLIHEAVIDAHGHEQGIHNYGILYMIAVNASKLDKPEDVAATYLNFIASQQPFYDGNRRTSLTSACVFLRINGLTFKFKDKDIYKLVTDIKDNDFTTEQISKYIKEFMGSKSPLSFFDALSWFIKKNEKLLIAIGELRGT